MSTLVNNFYKKADIDVALNGLIEEINACEPLGSYPAQYLNNVKKKIQIMGLTPAAVNDIYINLQMKFSYDKNVQVLLQTMNELFTSLKFRLYQAAQTMCDDCECEKFLQLLDEFNDEKSLIDGINKGQFRQFAQNPSIEQILSDHVPCDSDYIKFYATPTSPRFEYVNGDVRYVSINNVLYEIVDNHIQVCHTMTQNTVLLRELNALLDRGLVEITSNGLKLYNIESQEEAMIIDAENNTCQIKAFNGNWIQFTSDETVDVYGTIATMESFVRNREDMWQVRNMRLLWGIYNDEADMIINLDPQYIKTYESALENVPSYALLWCGKNVIDLNNFCEYENFDAFVGAQNPLYCFMKFSTSIEISKEGGYEYLLSFFIIIYRRKSIMYHLLNTNIRCSSKMIFLIALNNVDKPFDVRDPYINNAELWIGAVDNSIVPFKSTGSFTDDVAMFFSVSSQPFEANYYRISYAQDSLLGTKYPAQNNLLKYQYEGVDQIYSKFNYMFHSTLFNPSSGGDASALFSEEWVEDTFSDIELSITVFSKNQRIRLDKIFNKQYFQKSGSDIALSSVMDIDTEGRFKIGGINNNGQLCYVTVPPPDQFISPIHFQKKIIDIFKNNKIFDFRIINIGFLFNSDITHESCEHTKDGYPITHAPLEIVSSFNVYDGMSTCDKRIFNYDYFRTTLEVDKPDDTKIPHHQTGRRDSQRMSVDVYPFEMYQYIDDPERKYKVEDYKHSIYKELIDYVEIYNNEKSLYKAPVQDVVLEDLNEQLPPSNLNQGLLSKKSFVISSYKEEELEKYNLYCAQNRVDTHATFYNITDEMNRPSVENTNVHTYSLNLPGSMIAEFNITDLSGYKKFCPLNAEYLTAGDIEEILEKSKEPVEGEPYTHWVPIEPLDEFSTASIFQGIKQFGCWTITIADSGYLLCKIKLDLDSICNCLYKKEVVNIRKLHLYSENWLLSDVLLFLDAYTTFRATSLTVSNIRTEYNFELGCAKEDSVNELIENNRLILPLHKSTPNYEERTELINKLEYALYDPDGDIKPLLNYNLNNTNYIKPLDDENEDILKNTYNGYKVPFDYFEQYNPSQKNRMKFKTEKDFGGVYRDLNYFNNIYKDEKDICVGYSGEKDETPLIVWRIYTKIK